MAVLPRVAWDKRAPVGPSSIYPTGPAEVVWLHNTAGAIEPASATQAHESERIDAIQAYHTDPPAEGGRGWSDIAYSFMVAPSGRGYVCRGYLRRHGANLGDSNADSISICLLGNYDTQQPTEPQIATVQSIIAAGIDQGAVVPVYALLGHRDEPAPKSCPGSKIAGPPYSPFIYREGDSTAMLTDEERAQLDDIHAKVKWLYLREKNLKEAGLTPASVRELLAVADPTDPTASATISPEAARALLAALGVVAVEDVDDAEHPEGP